MTDEDLQDDLVEWFENTSPEDRFEAVKSKLKDLENHLLCQSLRIQEDIYNVGLETIKNGILIVYCALHDEH